MGEGGGATSGTTSSSRECWCWEDAFQGNTPSAASGYGYGYAPSSSYNVLEYGEVYSPGYGLGGSYGARRGGGGGVAMKRMR